MLWGDGVSRREIEDKLFLAFEDEVRRAGVELLDVELTSEAKRTVLRVVIYSPDGVTLDDCVEVDRILGPILDQMDPITESYNLEVSSPGLERVLRRDKEYRLFAGRKCRVNLFAPYEGTRSVEGVLMGLSDDGQSVLVRPDGEPISLPRSNISKVKLVYEGE